MVKKIIIIGSGAIAKLHEKIIRKKYSKFSIERFSSREFSKISKISTLKNKIINPNYFIICSPSSLHFKHFMTIEKNFVNKSVLIEKPLFEKIQKIKKKLNNFYSIGYNLRYHPVLIFLKKIIKNKKIFSIKINSSSYLPKWRKIDYVKSVSSKKSLGGGVLLEMSHELDFLVWIFGKIKIISALNKKVSHLKINTDDLLILNAEDKKKSIISMNINFFSRIIKREIIVDGKDFNFYGNLIKNEIIFFKKNIKKRIKFSNFKLQKTYELQLQDLINKNNQNSCSIKDGLYLLSLIKKIKKLN